MVLQLSAQLLLFVIALRKFHYVCFRMMFSLKTTNIVSVSQFRLKYSTMETELGILFQRLAISF